MRTIRNMARPGLALSEAFSRTAPDGGQPTWRVLVVGIWLVYLVQPAATLFQHHYAVAKITLGIAILVVFCASYVGMLLSWRNPPRRAVWVLPLLFVLAGVATLQFDVEKWNTLWAYVSISCGLMPRSYRVASRAVLASSACFLMTSVAARDNAADYLVALLPITLVGFVMIGARRQYELMKELKQARETVARMAANEERLRLARDMHDLTGQSLSMITLKSELAARLAGRLPESPERDRVRDEVEQVAVISRQTLRDIRQAVSGYRRPTLAVEIITARSALEAAGITPHDDAGLTLASGTFDADAEAALAWCLREAVTNAVKHSGAQNCHVSLARSAGSVSLCVRDDGSGRVAAEATGTGLRGMSERLSAVGGQLELRPGTDGFRLLATVPAVVPDAASARRGATVST